MEQQVPMWFVHKFWHLLRSCKLTLAVRIHIGIKSIYSSMNILFLDWSKACFCTPLLSMIKWKVQRCSNFCTSCMHKVLAMPLTDVMSAFKLIWRGILWTGMTRSYNLTPLINQVNNETICGLFFVLALHEIKNQALFVQMKTEHDQIFIQHNLRLYTKWSLLFRLESNINYLCNIYIDSPFTSQKRTISPGRSCSWNRFSTSSSMKKIFSQEDEFIRIIKMW